MGRFRLRDRVFIRFLVVLLVLMVVPPAHADKKRPLRFEDVMKFRAIHDPVISEDGRWLAFEARPDRGDGEVVVQSLTGKQRYRIERGRKPVFTRNARWVGVKQEPPAAEKVSRSKKDKPLRPDLQLLNTATGETFAARAVERFVFSNNSRWIAYRHYAENANKKKSHRPVGSQLVLRELDSGKSYSVPFVTEFAFDSLAQFLAFSVSDTSGQANGLYLFRLTADSVVRDTILSRENGFFSQLTWNARTGQLAFLMSRLDADGLPGPARMMIWSPETMTVETVLDSAGYPEAMVLPPQNTLKWSRDGQRLFFGFQPQWLFQWNLKLKKSDAEEDSLTEAEKQKRLFDLSTILEQRKVDVWHWNDPLIIPNQKKEWKKESQRRYLAVYHRDSREVVLLADSLMPKVEVPENASVALGISSIPYRKEITWAGWFFDVYVVDLRTGQRTQVVQKISHGVELSPEGRFVVYYRDGHWYLFDVQQNAHRNLTAGLDVPFANEDHDYPSPPPGYGVAGWVKGDQAVLIYDKYDIWQFPTNGDSPICLTGGQGREQTMIYRVIRLDKERTFFKPGERLLLYGYHDREKYRGFYEAQVGAVGVQKRLQERKRFTFLAKAREADRVIYTRESYQEFPDIWVSDLQFKKRRKVTRVNPQMKEFLWGTARLVEWRSEDGIPLQGVLLLPEDYQPGKRYPVLVYFYRFFSQRLYEFNQPVINHRPCFPLYTSNGYAIFLPDIRFEVGRPGYSAVKCLVPGVQKLIDMGIADPDAIALHGHSWSGYQTAFVVTQTNLFKCAIAGAPVSNMTSAYSGIRWGSGLARQFQYEISQSRIGGSLWEYPERYYLNSPVFFADRIQTPLLIMFGDEDEAVPWYQGIELYLAMRRLGKTCVFLQYRGEGHHLKQYANKLDYAMKMKQFLDHYLKGAPAPKWLEKGVPYRGK
ncbi:MAG: S9 family peptidase [Calditrichaeota bacterium]|nr:S9 family peptidase [Calditrichota bacterium]